jgi:hypothetical protein
MYVVTSTALACSVKGRSFAFHAASSFSTRRRVATRSCRFRLCCPRTHLTLALTRYARERGARSSFQPICASRTQHKALSFTRRSPQHARSSTTSHKVRVSYLAARPRFCGLLLCVAQHPDLFAASLTAHRVDDWFRYVVGPPEPTSHSECIRSVPVPSVSIGFDGCQSTAAVAEMMALPGVLLDTSVEDDWDLE